MTFRERERKRGRGRERSGQQKREKEKQRNTDVRENIARLPPVCTPTGDETCNLLVHRTVFQPTELPGQDSGIILSPPPTTAVPPSHWRFSRQSPGPIKSGSCSLRTILGSAQPLPLNSVIHSFHQKLSSSQEAPATLLRFGTPSVLIRSRRVPLSSITCHWARLHVSV